METVGIAQQPARRGRRITTQAHQRQAQGSWKKSPPRTQPLNTRAPVARVPLPAAADALLPAPRGRCRSPAARTKPQRHQHGSHPHPVCRSPRWASRTLTYRRHVSQAPRDARQEAAEAATQVPQPLNTRRAARRPHRGAFRSIHSGWRADPRQRANTSRRWAQARFYVAPLAGQPAL